MGPGRSSAFGGRHLLTVHRVASDRRDNFTALPVKLADAQSQIKFAHLATGKLLAQTQMSCIVFRDHKATTGLFIETMYDSGPKLAADSTQILNVVE